MTKVVTIINIRPDIIRLSNVISRLDRCCNHIIISTGQHYDSNLSDIFYSEFHIRKPDYNLCAGAADKDPMSMVADAWLKLKPILEKEKPDTVILLGDANGVLLSVPIKKAGWHITRIEAGMRSFDRRMPEEINRITADHVSDLLFVYHNNYKQHLINEGVSPAKIHVIGNTIVEPVKYYSKDLFVNPSKNDKILLDVHRNENLINKDRLFKIMKFASYAGSYFGLPVHLIAFGRTLKQIELFKIKNDANIKTIPLMNFTDHLRSQYDSRFIISDSGTDQDQCILLNKPVIVPRDFTERPESADSNCSYMLRSVCNFFLWKHAIIWLKKWENGDMRYDKSWLGDGNTSRNIVNTIMRTL